MVYSLLKSNNLSTCKNYKNRVFYADPWPNPAKIFDPVTWRPGSNTESNDKLWCRLWQRSSVWSSAVLRLLPRSDVQCMDRWTTPVDSGQLSGCIVIAKYHTTRAPCGLRGWKNRPAPFPGRKSHKATKPGSVCPVLAYILSVSDVLLTSAPVCVVLFYVICVFCLLVVVVVLLFASDWLERFVSEMTYNVLMGTLNPTHSLYTHAEWWRNT